MKVFPTRGLIAVKRKFIIACFLVPVIAVALFLVQLAFFPWSQINCWTYQVDINSGQIRYTRYLVFIPVKRTIEESSLSRALGKQDFSNPKHEWYNVLTLSPGVRHSPHYIFHSAINQIRQLEGTWDMGRFTPAARRSSAKHVLALWQEGKRDYAADQYIQALSDLASRSYDANKSTDEKDLPVM